MSAVVDLFMSSSKVRYLLIGTAAFLVELLVIFVAQAWGASGTLAVACSFFIGLGVSFLLQKIITFQDKRFHHKIVLNQVLLYGALVAFNFGFTITAVWLFENYVPPALIRTVALAITTIWNYYLYKTRIFQTE